MVEGQALNEILKIIAITFIPALELRASIPFGIFSTSYTWIEVFIISIVANIILGVFVFVILDYFVNIVTKVPFFDKIWDLYVKKTQKRIEKGVNKYGEWAVAVFIGIPLPGSGVYTGALASYLIGLKLKKFLIANVIGVLIAGILVTVACLTGIEAFKIFIKNY